MTCGVRGGHNFNPARISAPDEIKIARRRVQLHAARQCRPAGRLSAGKLTLRLIAELTETSPICGGGLRRRRAAYALAPLTTSYF